MTFPDPEQSKKIKIIIKISLYIFGNFSASQKQLSLPDQIYFEDIYLFH